jgi:hypothetical protein
VFVMDAPNPEYAHNCLMAALRVLERGGSLHDSIVIPPYGQSWRVDSALSLASCSLDEPFHADELPAVDRAYRATGLTRTSDNKKTVALEIFETLVRKGTY